MGFIGRIGFLPLVFLCLIPVYPQTTLNLSGVVCAPDSSPISGASVTLNHSTDVKTTDLAGRFHFDGVLDISADLLPLRDPYLKASDLYLYASGTEAELSVALYSLNGIALKRLVQKHPEPGEHIISLPSLAGDLGNGLYLAEVIMGKTSRVFRFFHTLNVSPIQITTQNRERTASRKRSSASPNPDSITITAVGFQNKVVIPSSLTQGDLGKIFLVPDPIMREITIAFDSASPQLKWAVTRLDSAIRSLGSSPVHRPKGAQATISVEIKSESPVAAEGFQISIVGNNISVLAKDAVGAMYGILDVSEQLRTTKSLSAVSAKAVNPRFPFRAIKFNLPWSSYRIGEALSLHTETVRDTLFWKAFLDMMAENRYNALTLWNMHPWPYLIRPKNFPKATPFSDQELDKWRTMWRTLFRMAKERGVKTYLVNWNIYVSEAFKANYDPSAFTDGGSEVGEGTLSEQVRRYSRECVTQVINEYPDLTGLGTSAGDRMTNQTPQESQDWITDVYYNGIKAANRQVEFIHRAAFRGTNADLITRASMEASGLEKPLWTELKFNWSHGFSTPTLVQIHGDGGPQGADKYFIPSPTKYKVNWMIRNEDMFVLRWGQANFIRKHIAQNGQEYVGGYFLGSETYIPATDYIHQPGHAHVDWKYEFERKWLMFMEWGRLLYDPATPDKVFSAEFDRKYGPGKGDGLFKAYELVSIAPLRFASYAKSTWDFTLYTEAFKKSGFFTLDELIAEVPFDKKYMGINEYVKAGEKTSPGRISPPELAAELERNAAQALSILSGLGSSPSALVCEKYDIETWADFGLYFAKKIRAGMEKAKGNASASRVLMKEAVTYWEEMVRINKLHNRASIPNMQSGSFSWESMLGQVRQEAN